MNEKKNRYEKRFQFQQKMISRQSEQIDNLKLKIEQLEQKLKEKDEIINSVELTRKEMAENANEQKILKNDYQKLIQELKTMKKIVNQEVYRGRWKIVRWIINL